jgi:hypothetical protein
VWVGEAVGSVGVGEISGIPASTVAVGDEVRAWVDVMVTTTGVDDSVAGGTGEDVGLDRGVEPAVSKAETCADAHPASKNRPHTNKAA